jgi:hypothetical protein
VRYYFVEVWNARVVYRTWRCQGHRSTGRISLGKQFAGQQVLVEEQEPGVRLIRTATVVPDNERWLQRPEAAKDLRAAQAWAQANKAADDDIDNVLAKMSE